MSEPDPGSSDASGPIKWLMRALIKLSWAVGGKRETSSGFRRLAGADVTRHLEAVSTGDFLLMGNDGVCSHVAVHVGDGVIVHSMATEKTMRGWVGSVVDTLTRPWRWALGQRENTGVIEEPLASFLDRYERDTWVAVRRIGLGKDQIARGVARVRALVGKAYDYDFSSNDDEYYCTEIVVEFLDAALHPETSPKLEARRVQVPGLLDTWVIEPVALFEADQMAVVAASTSAKARYGQHLGDAELFD